jgi:hypothetical protein
MVNKGFRGGYLPTPAYITYYFHILLVTAKFELKLPYTAMCRLQYGIIPVS